MSLVLSLLGGVVRRAMGNDQDHSSQNRDLNQDHYNQHPNQQYPRDSHPSYPQAPALYPPQSTPWAGHCRHGQPCSCAQYNYSAGLGQPSMPTTRRERKRGRKAERHAWKAQPLGMAIPMGTPPMTSGPGGGGSGRRGMRRGGRNSAAREIGAAIGSAISGRNGSGNGGHNSRGLETQMAGQSGGYVRSRRASFDGESSGEEEEEEEDRPPAYEQSAGITRRRSFEVPVPEQKSRI
ncbi:hypothetical protein BJ170DRAFT_596149 [Xylariales sp. AK1849]|nr:hypothetical protein BJ170DRAFT_596149 [Xylariales sp. AK1849]